MVITQSNLRVVLCWGLGVMLLLANLSCASKPEKTPAGFEPGNIYFGANQYIEFQPGELPVILGVPHGGALAGSGLPDRTGTAPDGSPIATTPDNFTQELARDIVDEFQAQTGRKPHVIYCHLLRVKLDANREIVEAAQGNAQAETAWREYHGFIESARKMVIAKQGRGFLLDIHGHGHTKQRIEWGYLLTKADLNEPDGTLNGATYVQKSSLRRLVEDTGTSLVTLIRGPQSLGGLLETKNVKSVPSPSDPAPLLTDDFFSGGYTTATHASRQGGPIDGVQMETNRDLRDTSTERKQLAKDFVEQFKVFYQAHYKKAL